MSIIITTRSTFKENKSTSYEPTNYYSEQTIAYCCHLKSAEVDGKNEENPIGFECETEFEVNLKK